MHKTLRITIIIILLLLLGCSYTTTAETDIQIERQEITISLMDQGLFIEEEITYKNTVISNKSLLSFSVPSTATQITLLESGTSESFLIYPLDETTYEFNLTDINTELKTDESILLLLTYTLPTNTGSYQKTLLYDTKYLVIQFNEQTIYQAENLQFSANTKNSVTLTLYRPTEAPLSLTGLIIIFSLVVILILVLLLLGRKKRITKNAAESDSEELLSIKKTLFLSLLKNLEKQHRSKEISDDTYTKLKSEYKQKTVTVMKKLDDLSNKK